MPVPLNLSVPVTLLIYVIDISLSILKTNCCHISLSTICYATLHNSIFLSFLHLTCFFISQFLYSLIWVFYYQNIFSVNFFLEFLNKFYLIYLHTVNPVFLVYFQLNFELRICWSSPNFCVKYPWLVVRR